MTYFIGVDVGTASVRAGLFDGNGKLIDSRSNPINIFNFRADFYEQSSEEIWNSVCFCIRQILDNNKSVKIEDIATIGFDATCSLVALDEDFKPVTVSPSGDDSINIIMWMDHRSRDQADFINSTKHESLKSVGGKISLEMDPPKILWLKQNLFEQSYKRVAHFFSLPDYLVWRCSDKNIRSVCCTTCKWLYKSTPNDQRWDETFWNLIGLGDLTEDNFSKIGSKVEKPFKYCDELLISKEAAESTGLSPNVKVGISMIDAHAGAIGGLAVTQGFLKRNAFPHISLDEILVLVSGTSSCFMATNKDPKFLDGIWGPYFQAMVPDMWLNEAGQSACGKLLDHLITSHPAYEELVKKTQEDNSSSIHETLENILEELIDDRGLTNDTMSLLTKNINIYPDFHGNRSPLADNLMKGQISGLDFDKSIENLAIVYLATIQSLAYQAKHIIQILNSHNENFKLINIIGGLSSNTLYCQLHSDICGIPVLVKQKGDSSVLFGAAIAGSSNFSKFKDYNFEQLLDNFGSSDLSDTELLEPNGKLEKYHQAKYNVYLTMIDDQIKYRNMLKDF